MVDVIVLEVHSEIVEYFLTLIVLGVDLVGQHRVEGDDNYWP